MNISVVSYDQSWPEAFALEADQLNSVLSSTLLQIHHIGSTAIPDILAKPIIDILIEADALESIDRKNRSLEALGYEAKGEYGISGRRYFQKKDQMGNRTHHVHIYESGSTHICRHLAFRDYLIAHRDVAKEYSLLKADLVRDFPEIREHYINGKDAFVKKIEHMALNWYKN